MKRYKSSVIYFLTEGKTNLSECVKLSIQQAHRAGIPKVVMFTASGEGLEVACKQSHDLIASGEVRLIGVSFAFGSVKPDALVIPPEREELFRRLQIPIIHAADPLADIPKPNKNMEDNLIRRTLEFFSGGMELCVRAAVVACDAGLVEQGEHVIAMSADTSVILKAVPSSRMFAALSIREIICKPIVQDVTKGESISAEVNVEALLQRRRALRRVLPVSSKSIDQPKPSETD